ncbi:MAG: exopolysaccharide export protein VpsN [Myxococcota bacterium]
MKYLPRIGLLAFLVFLAACHSGRPDASLSPSKQPPSQKSGIAESDAEPVIPEYVLAQINANTLGAGDIIEVKVIDHQELSGRYEVFSDGTIRFPLIGNISVDSLDPNQVAEIIRSKLADGFLTNPQVSIFVVERNSKKIFILGQVKKPGTFTYEENMTIIQAITMAEGFSERASKNDTSVTRVVEGKTRRIPVPIERIGKGDAPNFILKPGDIVYVPESIF